jgi:hypothetical protein
LHTLAFPPVIGYNARMSNPLDPNFTDETNDSDLLPYDDTFNDEDFVAELIAEGYSEEEAKRMAGEYDSDDDEYCFDDHDKDIPDYVDEEDFG